jgi:hypothetical protein
MDTATAISAQVHQPRAIPYVTDANHYRFNIRKRQQAEEGEDDLWKADNITLPVDHFGNGTGIFENHYWVHDVAYKPGEPVIRSIPIPLCRILY